MNQSHSGPIADIEGFDQLLPGIYKSEKPINIAGVDKFHLKCDCNNGSFVNGVTEPFLYFFALTSPSGFKIYKEPRIKLFEKVNKPSLSHIRFHIEDDDHKPVDFKRETISFTCPLFKTR